MRYDPTRQQAGMTMLSPALKSAIRVYPAAAAGRRQCPARARVRDYLVILAIGGRPSLS